MWKKWVRDMMGDSFSYGLKSAGKSKRREIRKPIKLAVHKILDTYLTGNKDYSREHQDYSAALLLLSSQYINVQYKFRELLNHQTISEMIKLRGIEFFPLKALLILGYDLRNPEFVRHVAQKDISHVRINSFMDTLLHNYILPKNLEDDDISSTIDSVLDHISSHKRDIDNNWNVITRIMFLYYDVKPYVARNTYLQCSSRSTCVKGVDACFYEPLVVCEGCEGYRKLRLRYEEFLKNVTLFDLLFANKN
jgi:hypothetical protein